MSNLINTRAAAAKVINRVVEKGESLNTALPKQAQKVAERDKALLQELCYGVLRYLPRLDFFCRSLMEKPLKGKQREAHFLVLVGIYQQLYTRIPPHAAVADTVNGVKDLKAHSLKGLINGVLRSFQRQQDELIQQADEKEALVFNHPSWLVNRLKAAYPDTFEQILAANNEKAPMWIRVNQSTEQLINYQKSLEESGIAASTTAKLSSGLLLEKPVDVNRLPDFATGASSVQDGAAQMAAQLLNCQPDELVLDACAAPGGKTAHILESQPRLKHLVAVDFDSKRLARVSENLERIGLEAELINGDASEPDSWWQGEQFDRILLDAPCSATGVIRRHPDIKWLRRDSDIAELARLQAKILRAMWLKLKPGGTLLYATCSVLPDENSHQIKEFLQETPDAILAKLTESETQEQPGLQLLPGQDNMDGFYYAKLTKQA